MLLVIISNMIVQSLKSPEIDPKVEYFMHMYNYVCAILYIIEAGIKVLVFGPVLYFKNGGNVLGNIFI
jgi:hypothetical protein